VVKSRKRSAKELPSIAWGCAAVKKSSGLRSLSRSRGERENHSFSGTNLRFGFEMNRSTGHFELVPFGTGDERKSMAIPRLSLSARPPSLFFKSAFRIGSTILEKALRNSFSTWTIVPSWNPRI